MDSGKSVAGKQSKPSHFDAAPFLVAAASVFITPEPGMSLPRNLFSYISRRVAALRATRVTATA
jgi:hypothetical protein